MSYDYLFLTNEVLARMNEVSLTSAGFNSARGFQIQCKNAVNDSINFIDQACFYWPFNHVTHTELLEVGKSRYETPLGTKVVDYDTFRVLKSKELNTDGMTLVCLDYTEYLNKFAVQEETPDTGQLPRRVARTPDNNFLIYPYADKEYTLRYELFVRTEALVAPLDVPRIPEMYRQVIADGATAFAYQYRGEKDQYAINWQRFNKGIEDMRTLLVNRDPYARSTVIHY